MSNLGKVLRNVVLETEKFVVQNEEIKKFNNSFCQKNKYLSVKILDHF